MRRNFRKWAVLIAVFVFIVLFCLFTTGEIMIGMGVRRSIQMAQEQFPGDRVEALIAMIECKSCKMEERNHAVWALGQLKDKRALPALYKYRTGKPCNHSRLICQYELSKSIRWTEGNSFMLPQLWRIMLW